MANATHRTMHALILAGGSGTRLWPLSREELPKQFLSLSGTRTLLQQTVDRMCAVVPPSRIRVVASERWRSLVTHQLKDIVGIPKDPVVGEPAARSTAPAIALGATHLLDEGAAPDDLLLVCPSDHYIADREAFSRAVEIASEAASDDALVTFGIVPEWPETGYGYIEAPPDESLPWRNVSRFVEKPDAATAQAYIDSGNFFWNAGIFCFSITSFLSALDEYIPDLGALARLGSAALTEAFPSLPPAPLEYSIMEKIGGIRCVPLAAGWSDVGCWDTVYDVSPKDVSGNATSGDVQLFDSSNTLVRGDRRLVVGMGLTNMIVVDTQDALMVANRGCCQNMRGMIHALKSLHRRELVETPESTRPWGTYRVLFQGDRFKIKHITINPGMRLSLQYHFHRSEHWVVVRGTAKVSVNDREQLFHEGESVFVPKSAVHRLENPGRVPLEIVEIQNGEYLGEDDIIRIQDDFNR
jgi:mannose-1-phosphate guanylyltransferase/mannose-6-phosphate isomerase